jgi:putative intracellular protease/amidase
MKKTIAVLAVNPVNGAGLFQYLEAFYESKIPYTTFAVSDTPTVMTNSGVKLHTDDIVANLKDRTEEFHALVFACGDAMPRFGQNATLQYNQDMLAVIKSFDESGKMLIGHCAAALLFDNLSIGTGRKVALHPFIKNIMKGCTGTDEKAVVDGNLYTAQTEHSIAALLPAVLEALK